LSSVSGNIGERVDAGGELEISFDEIFLEFFDDACRFVVDLCRLKRSDFCGFTII
jgi:hypothetical protein